ncbi:MAG: chromosome segregation protein SMC, partial [Planctomycetota bacterium]|nr:chromosome segregation protein SMC [Planctomycetota bacterium]
MHLSKLEAFGFKSFADRTTFDLAPGLTGIVGPNGCGKSNVVDAIRWVLGEQSAKSLRGSEMMDVIFNGAGTRKPLGMAEVSLTFSDVQGTLRVEQDEVSITRRLFRSGESEYLINKQPCRLKDIREMFMDTGIGKESYSVIEQGKIDALLQANAQQRRLIFEEAAGISRYKAKRKETERRLERIDGNLQRLCDIIEEVEKQIRSVKAQASRARRYAELLEEWKRRRLSLAGARRGALRIDEERIAQRLGSLREEEAIAGARLSALEADLSTAEVELSGIEDQLLQVRGDAARVESRIASEQERSEMERERSSRLEEEAKRLLSQAEQHKLRIGQNIRDLRAKRKHLDEAEAEARRVEEQIRSGSVQEEELDQQERRIRSEEDERRIRHHDALTQRAHAQNRRDALDSTLERIVQKLGRLEEESARISEEKEALGDRRREEAADRQTALDDVGRRRIFLQARTSYRQRLESSQKLREQKMTGLERRKAAVESGLEVLQGIRSEMDGVQEGVKSLLSINGNDGFPGLGKMIADCIDVDLQYANALEAALGGQAQAILAEATGSAIDAIQYLKSEEKGRASLLPLDLPDRNGTRPPLQGPGLVGLASSLVRAPDSLRPMVESLLGHTWVVENLEVALRLSRNGGTGETFVTLDGDRIDSKGFISGGRGDRSSGLIVNRSQFRSLEEEQELLDERAASIRGLQEETEERLDSISRKISGEQSKIDEGEGIVADAVEELRRLDQTLALLDERLSMGRLEVSELRRQRAATEAEHADAVEEAARSDLEARSL